MAYNKAPACLTQAGAFLYMWHIIKAPSARGLPRKRVGESA